MSSRTVPYCLTEFLAPLVHDADLPHHKWHECLKSASDQTEHYLVLVQLTVLILLLSLLLKCDDDETDENVHHEKGDDNDVDDEEDRNDHAVVVDWTDIFSVRVYGFVQQPNRPG